MINKDVTAVTINPLYKRPLYFTITKLTNQVPIIEVITQTPPIMGKSLI